jgi:hypothetical protein
MKCPCCGNDLYICSSGDGITIELFRQCSNCGYTMRMLTDINGLILKCNIHKEITK